MVMSCADSLRGPLHLYSSYLTSSGAFLTAAPTIVEARAVGEEIQHKNRKAHKTEKNRTVRQEKYECHASREMFKVRRESCPAVQSERLLLSAGALPKDRVRFPPSPAQQTCLWSLWIAVSLYQFQYRVAPGMGKRFSWNEGGGCAVRWARSCGSTACCRCWVWRHGLRGSRSGPRLCRLCRAVAGLHACSWQDEPERGLAAGCKGLRCWSYTGANPLAHRRWSQANVV